MKNIEKSMFFFESPGLFQEENLSLPERLPVETSQLIQKRLWIFVMFHEKSSLRNQFSFFAFCSWKNNFLKRIHFESPGLFIEENLSLPKGFPLEASQLVRNILFVIYKKGMFHDRSSLWCPRVIFIFFSWQTHKKTYPCLLLNVMACS